jgi:hypothetical protein
MGMEKVNIQSQFTIFFCRIHASFQSHLTEALAKLTSNQTPSVLYSKKEIPSDEKVLDIFIQKSGIYSYFTISLLSLQLSLSN